MSAFFASVASFFGTLALGTVLPVVIILVVGILAIRLLMKIVNTALEKSKLDKAAHGLIKSLLQTVLYVLLGLIIASKLGIDVTGIVDYFSGSYQVKVFETSDIKVH